MKLTKAEEQKIEQTITVLEDFQTRHREVMEQNPPGEGKIDPLIGMLFACSIAQGKVLIAILKSGL